MNQPVSEKNRFSGLLMRNILLPSTLFAYRKSFDCNIVANEYDTADWIDEDDIDMTLFFTSRELRKV